MEFCDEEEQFYMLFRELRSEVSDRKFLEAVPYSPHGCTQFGLYSSKDLLLDPLPPQVQDDLLICRCSSHLLRDGLLLTR